MIPFSRRKTLTASQRRSLSSVLRRCRSMTEPEAMKRTLSKNPSHKRAKTSAFIAHWKPYVALTTSTPTTEVYCSEKSVRSTDQQQIANLTPPADLLFTKPVSLYTLNRRFCYTQHIFATTLLSKINNLSDYRLTLIDNRFSPINIGLLLMQLFRVSIYNCSAHLMEFQL